MLYGRWLQSMVESIQNRIYHRLNQLQIESTISRINQWLNLSIVESTYGCKESQKSKKVKNPPKCRTLALYQTKVRQSSRIPGRPDPGRGMRPYRWVLRAGELESWGVRAGSCKLEASWKLALQS